MRSGGSARKRSNQYKPRKRRTKAEIERAKKKSEASRRYYLKKRHQMSEVQYDSILVFQEGLCAICRRARGIARKLAVDHNHREAETHDHSHETSCIDCWRGLLCTNCNDLLGHLRDDVEALKRAIEYLQNPPVKRWREQQEDG